MLPVDTFFALSAAKYYAKRESAIGESGDFITSPEISQIFCQAVAIWVYNLAHSYKSISLVELGPGNGTLMNEIITFLKKEIFIKDVFFVETSQKMIDKQKKLVAQHKETHFHWVNSIDQLPTDTKHIFIGNEFFDALPVKQFIKENNNFYEIFITEDLKSNEAIKQEQMNDIMLYSNSSPDSFADGEIFELSTVSLTTLKEICDLCIGALIIDYGYYTPTMRNTIKAIANHTILDHFAVEPGTADISAEVDFGSLDNFVKSHYTTYKTFYSTQKSFLKRHYLDVLSEKAKLHAKNQSEIAMINNEIKKISEDMGEIFKVLEIYK